WDSPDKESSLPAPTLASGGRITRSNRITAGGTGQMPITITTGMIPFMTVLRILVATIRHSLVTISATVRIRPAQPSAMTAAATKSAWHPARSGSVVATWTRALAHRRDTLSAWNFSWRHTLSAATQARAIRLRHPILRLTRGVVL